MCDFGYVSPKPQKYIYTLIKLKKTKQKGHMSFICKNANGTHMKHEMCCSGSEC